MNLIPFEPYPEDISKMYVYTDDDGEPVFVTRHVVCAANRRQSDGLIICGARHWDMIMRNIADALGDTCVEWDQGFIDQWGKYLTREEAAEIVKKTGQPLREGEDLYKKLFSENLY